MLCGCPRPYVSTTSLALKCFSPEAMAFNMPIWVGVSSSISVKNKSSLVSKTSWSWLSRSSCVTSLSVCDHRKKQYCCTYQELYFTLSHRHSAWLSEIVFPVFLKLLMMYGIQYSLAILFRFISCPNLKKGLFALLKISFIMCILLP